MASNDSTTEMTAHTPGPWREGPTDGIGQRGKLTVVDANGLKVADCEARRVGLKYERPLPEDTANARLVSAAPELLAALLEMVDMHGGTHDDDCPMDDTCDCSHAPFNARVNDAIRKATGFVLLLSCALLFSACGTSPISPTRSAMLRAAVTGYVWFDPDILGHERVTNTRAVSETHTSIVWDVADGVNQIDKGRSEPWSVAPGQSVDIPVTFTVLDGVCYQRDDYRNLPRQSIYTQSDVANYFYGGDEHRRPIGCQAKPPTTTVPPSTTTTIPVQQSCSADSFVRWWHVLNGSSETEYATVKPGRGGFVAYLMAWGVPSRFEFGGVPIPQMRVHQTERSRPA